MINYPTGDKNASTIYRSLELIGTVGAVFRELDAEFIEEVPSKSFGQSLTNTVEVGGLNKMTAVLGYLIGLLIYSPFNLIIHELGHAFFIKLLGGKINKIQIGVGGPLINLKGFSFNKYFFILGYVDFDYSTVKIKNKIGDFFIIFGGVLFNIISLIIVILIFNAYNPNSFLKGYYIGFTITLIISALIPVTYPNGYDSDGKNIFKLLIGNRKY
ncbi:site-2 protease family protein [Oceanobacillus sp. AG]|uniref:site-2 protease family protein n=1 Tax=Oceanobacillus sp. AG TaxID=2681969 RepID=UPI0012EB5CAC|nr:site-2 protease family protein [Oceanobacillus sp. AG]